MRDELPLPEALQHLVEKRQSGDRRKAAVAKAVPATPVKEERRRKPRRKAKR